MSKIEIKRALVSVHNKINLKLLANYFIKYDVEVLSTGGTAKFFKSFSKKIKVIEISSFTNFKEILDGRVKSLHPKIHSGILAKKDDVNHIKELKKINASFIDLVVVNLYPFEEISKKYSNKINKCIENIDIGGPTLIRGAAKNFKYVTILSNPNQYKKFLNEITLNGNKVSENFRHDCARIAFENSAFYESKISNWFNKDTKGLCIEKKSMSFEKISDLRYGENPHQRAACFKLGNNNLVKVSGKDLSYNNICDSETAIELAEQFKTPCCVILKHGNPCGVALDKNQGNAYSKALNCDKISAFGGIVAFNKTVNIQTAKKISNIFTEVIIAPKFSNQSKEILSLKKNLILIEYKNMKDKTKFHIKSTNNYVLIQEKNNKIIKIKDLLIKTKIKPLKKIMEDMIFAFTVSKYLNSNAIVIASKLRTLGIGVGQTSRLDSAKIAIRKMKEGTEHKNVVLASDGFFPFDDIVELCSKNQIKSIIQPGGSKKDNEIIDVANKLKISMVFTGIRHFKH